MALNHFSFFGVFFPILVVFLILGINGKAAAATDSPFCSKTDPGEQHDECNKLVTGAATWGDALTNVVQTAVRELEPVKSVVQGMRGTLPASLREVSKDSVVQTCKESIDMLFDSLEKVLSAIKNGDKTHSIDTNLSASFSSFSTCTDGMEEFEVDTAQFQKFSVILKKYANIGLAVSSAKPAQ